MKVSEASVQHREIGGKRVYTYESDQEGADNQCQTHGQSGAGQARQKSMNAESQNQYSRQATTFQKFTDTMQDFAPPGTRVRRTVFGVPLGSGGHKRRVLGTARTDAPAGHTCIQAFDRSPSDFPAMTILLRHDHIEKTSLIFPTKAHAVEAFSTNKYPGVSLISSWVVR